MIGSVLFAPNKDTESHRLNLWTRHWNPDGERQKIAVSRLGVFDFFSGLDTEAIAEIARSARERSVPSGTMVIRQGQVGDETYLLEKGSVGIYTQRKQDIQLIAVLDGPSVFGEMAVVDSERIRLASVEAISDLKLLVIPMRDLFGFLKRFAALRHNLRWMIAERSPKS